MKRINIGLLVSRLTLGVLMLLHGIAKIQHGVGGIEAMLKKAGLPEPLAYGVFIGEVLAPLMLILGLRTRVAALFYMGTMGLAIFLAHGSSLWSLSPVGGWSVELPALFFLGALGLFFTGGGKLALSAKSFWD